MNTFLDVVYRALRFFIDKIVGYGAATVMLAAVLLALLEIFRRYVFGVVFYWGQDAVTFFIIGSVYLFFAVTQAKRSHLAVTVLLDVFKRRDMHGVVRVVRVFNSTLSIAFFSAFAYWGIPAVERLQVTGRLTQSMTFFVWPFQACLLVGFALMALVSLFQLYQDIQALRGVTVFPWAETEEGIDI